MDSAGIGLLKEVLDGRIEQLEKLNGKNADFEMEMEEESEIEMILKQSVNSIHQFKNQIEDARDDQAIREAQKNFNWEIELQRKDHVQEKDNLLKKVLMLEENFICKQKELSECKKEVMSLRKTMETKDEDYQDQLFRLTTELAEERTLVKNQYQLHMKEKSEMKHNLTQIKKKHEKNLQLCYTTLLQLESKLNNYCKMLNGYTIKGQETHQFIMQGIKTAWHDMNARFKTIDCQLRAQKSAILHMQEEQIEFHRMHERSVAALTELEECLTDTSLQLEKQTEEKQIMQGDYEQQLSDLRTHYQEKAEEMAGEIASLKAHYDLEKATKEDLNTEMHSLNAKIEELATCNKELKDEVNKHKEKESDQEKRVCSLECEKDIMQQRLVYLTAEYEKYKLSEPYTISRSLSALRTLDAMQRQLDEQKACVEEQESQIKEQSCQWETEKETLMTFHDQDMKEWLEKQTQWENEQSLMQKSIKEETAKAKESFQLQISELHKDYTTKEHRLKSELTALVQSKEKDQIRYKNEVLEAKEKLKNLEELMISERQALEIKLTERTVELERFMDKEKELTSKIDECTVVLKEKEKDVEEKKKDWKLTVQRLEKKVTELTAKLNEQTKEAQSFKDHSQNTFNEIQRQLADKEIELYQALERLEQEKKEKRLNEEQTRACYEERISQLRKTSQCELDELRQKLEVEKVETMHNMKISYEQKMKEQQWKLEIEFENRLEGFNNMKTQEIEKLTEEKNNEIWNYQNHLNEQLTKEKTHMSEQLEHAKESTKDLCQQYEAEIDQLKEEWNNRLTEEKTTHAKECVKMQTTHAKELLAAQTNLENKILAMKEENEKKLQEKEGHMRKQMAQVREHHQQLVDSMKQREVKVLTEKEKIHKEELTKLRELMNSQETTSKQNLVDLESKFHAQTLDLIQELNEKQQLKEESRKLERTLKESLDQMEAKTIKQEKMLLEQRKELTEIYRREIQKQQEESSAELEKTCKSYELHLENKLRKEQELEKDFASLSMKYEARESRQEDLYEIERLRNENKAQREEMIGLQEVFNQLQRQMLLREENYNKHFRNGGAGDRVLNVDNALLSTTHVSDWMNSTIRRRFNSFKKK